MSAFDPFRTLADAAIFDRMRESDSLIHEFWSWFQANAREDDLSGQLNGGIGEWMDRLAVPDWETGPIGENGMFLAVSPGGNPDEYPHTKHIVALAPSMVGWTFLAARPKKDWNRVFLWSIHGEIDANLWKVVCFKYPDGFFELAFLDATVPQLPKNEKLALTEFVVASEVGEDALITKICTISFETEPTPEMLEASIPLSDLERAIG
jgi:hypothetical protein